MIFRFDQPGFEFRWLALSFGKVITRSPDLHDEEELFR
jgi:hypothetical protein